MNDKVDVDVIQRKQSRRYSNFLKPPKKCVSTANAFFQNVKFVYYIIPIAPMRHMMNSSPTQKKMSTFIRCSILLRL